MQVSPRNSPWVRRPCTPTPRPLSNLSATLVALLRTVAVGGAMPPSTVGPRIAILAAPVGQDARLIAWTAPLVGRATALAIQGQYLYVFGIGLHLFDVSNPAYPAGWVRSSPGVPASSLMETMRTLPASRTGSSSGPTSAIRAHRGWCPRSRHLPSPMMWPFMVISLMWSVGHQEWSLSM